MTIREGLSTLATTDFSNVRRKLNNGIRVSSFRAYIFVSYIHICFSFLIHFVGARCIISISY